MATYYNYLTKTTMKTLREKALLRFDNRLTLKFIEQIDETTFKTPRGEYLVLTDDEANKATYEEIEQSVWACNPSFLARYTRHGIEQEIIELLQEKCEDANNALKAMIIDFDYFVHEAVKTDGRGHFLSHYDGVEYEKTVQGVDFYIYRIN